MAALQSNEYALMVARAACCRSGTTRSAVAPHAGQTKATTIGNPSQNLAWKPQQATGVATGGWTVDKS